jgi:8-oxo-dGTP diphosphatase
MKYPFAPRLYMNAYVRVIYMSFSVPCALSYNNESFPVYVPSIAFLNNPRSMGTEMNQHTQTIEQETKPRVGIGIMVIKDGKMLLGKRKGSHGAGEYAFPGGHLEYMESYVDCAVREIAEECGIEVQNMRFQYLANIRAYAPRHYVHIGLIAEWKSGEPQVLEPDKVEYWDWYDLEKLPQPLFATIDKALEAYRTRKNFWDAS